MPSPHRLSVTNYAVVSEFPPRILSCLPSRHVDSAAETCHFPLPVLWDGIQQRKNSWEDGVLGTNCPIPSGWNWTYQYQVKDQIGSFFYFPSLGLQRAAGGYGGITVNNRDVIAVPFGKPDGDFTLFIGDWYTKNHTDLRKMLDDGKDLGMPDGVLMNGKGPYRYNDSLVPADQPQYGCWIIELSYCFAMEWSFFGNTSHDEVNSCR